MNARTALASTAIAALLLATATACGSLGTTTGGSTSGGTGTSGGSGVSGGTSAGVAAAGGAVTGGQSAPGGGTDRDNSCKFRFEPMPTGIIPGASVKGTVITVCAVPPRQHNMNLYIQRLVNGVWTDQNNKYIDTIPNAAFTPNIISAPCVPGKWRVRVNLSGTSASGIFWSVEDTYSEPRDVSASECG